MPERRFPRGCRTSTPPPRRSRSPGGSPECSGIRSRAPRRLQTILRSARAASPNSRCPTGTLHSRETQCRYPSQIPPAARTPRSRVAVEKPDTLRQRGAERRPSLLIRTPCFPGTYRNQYPRRQESPESGSRTGVTVRREPRHTPRRHRLCLRQSPRLPCRPERTGRPHLHTRPDREWRRSPK